MADIPVGMLRQTVTIETRLEDGLYGTEYEAPVSVPCKHSTESTYTRSVDASTLTYRGSLVVLPAHLPLFVEGSRATINGERFEVAACRAVEDGGLGGWEHGKVALQ